MALYRCMSGGGTSMNVLYSALKTNATANSYTFTQDYDTVYVINTSTRTAGTGLVATQVATPVLSEGTTNTIYNSGKIDNGIVLFLELNNVKSGDSVAVNGPNTGLIDSMIIFTI